MRTKYLKHLKTENIHIYIRNSVTNEKLEIMFNFTCQYCVLVHAGQQRCTASVIIIITNYCAILTFMVVKTWLY